VYCVLYCIVLFKLKKKKYDYEEQSRKNSGLEQFELGWPLFIVVIPVRMRRLILFYHWYLWSTI